MYGLKITVTNSDQPGARFTIDMPEVGREKIEAENPALAAVFQSFDRFTTDVGIKELKDLENSQE